MANDKLAGTIGGPTLTKEQLAVEAMLETYRKKALVGDDAVFDSANGMFLIHGKHKKLIGVEAVIAVDLASMLMAVAAVIQTTVVPILTGQLAVEAKRD